MDHSFLRYSCQIALPGFNESTQLALQNAKVLIVGAGGLGCPAAQYLASSGIGTLAIADFDSITIGNLHRQILFYDSEIGKPKATTMAEKLRLQNPFIEVISIEKKITSENVLELIHPYDIILDGTDNFETKYLLNDACVLSGKPLVHGAIYQYEGQVGVWNVDNNDGSRSPHFRDIFPEVDASLVPNCAEGGVIPTLAGIIGCMQANEVIKFITQSNDLLKGKLLIFDAKSMQTRIINIGKASNTIVTSLSKTESIPVISPSELKKNLDAKQVDLIDVRNHVERSEFSIGGTHIPVDVFNYESLELAEKRQTVIYCASGKRSGEVVRKLLKIYPNKEILSLSGGLKSWKETFV